MYLQVSVFSLLFVIYYIHYLKNNSNRNIYIKIGNSFYKYYTIPKNILTCNISNIVYKCIFTQNKNVKYNGVIYNGNKQFPAHPNSSYNIIMTIEKLSQVSFMKNIAEGKSKYYKLAVDYRLFSNRWHIPIPRFSNLSGFIYTCRSNFINIKNFMKRKDDIVYIQKIKYHNRRIIVKEIMKNYSVHSYGYDLNNQKWPYDIPSNNKLDILKKYKFCLAIENSVITWKPGNKFQASQLNDDYYTEKLIDCFKAGCIPIYFGPQNINEHLPDNNSIINLNNFNSIKDLIGYINLIRKNESILQSHLKWHNNYSKQWFNKFNKIYLFSYCNICNYVKKYS